MAGDALFGTQNFNMAVCLLEVADEFFTLGRAFGIAEDDVEAAEISELTG